MSDTDIQLFRLLDPEGKEIMSGPMSMIMECLPDTTARNEAINSMYRVASATVKAEERANEARAAATQILSDGITRLSTRLDTYIEQLEEQRKADAEEAEREEQEQIQATLDALPDPDQPSNPDPAPYSIDIKERVADEDPEGNIPPPRYPPDQEGHEPGPEPGTIDYPPHPQIASPVSVSLNSAEQNDVRY
jgi:vacuolar-type H+-ATPase subunit H